MPRRIKHQYTDYASGSSSSPPPRQALSLPSPSPANPLPALGPPSPSTPPPSSPPPRSPPPAIRPSSSRPPRPRHRASQLLAVPEDMAFSFSPAPQQSPFQTPAPQQSPFQTPALQQPPFQTPAPQQSMFQMPAAQPQQASSPFQFSFQQQPQAQQQQQQQVMAAAGRQQQQQQMMLCTVEGKPAGYNTKWEELHPDSQKLLLQIEDKIREYRDESERLDQCARLYDSSVSNDNFELEASRIVQELGRTTTAMEREKASIEELMAVSSEMIWNIEFSVRSYVMLRPRFIRPRAGNADGGSANPAVGAPTVATAQPYDFYSGVPKRPSLFMERTVARFEKYLGECCKWIGELEQLVQMDNNKGSSNSVESLPKVMSNVHDYFIYVASKVENLHQHIESLKTEYLHDQRRRGYGNDPFLEANRREEAKQEAAARRVHPTLHLPPNVQANTQIAAPLTSQPQQSSFPSAAASGSAFSTFSTPASAPTSSSLLFSAPTTPAPSVNLFASSGSAAQSTPFGTASTSLFGSTPSPSAFGASTPSFASTPAAGGTSLFSTPFAGGATASGASFGGASKSRGKARVSRR